MTAGPVTPASPTPPAPSRWPYLFNPKTAAGAVIAIITPLLLASETSLKAVYTSWFDECRIIVDVGPGKPGVLANDSKPQDPSVEIPVRLYPSGKPPDNLVLGFRTEKAALHQVRFERDFNLGNLAVHAQSGQTCPAETLCLEPRDLNTLHSDIKLAIKNFNSTLTYSFTAVLAGPDRNSMPAVYLLYLDDKDAAGNYPQAKSACRAEPPHLFNIIPRLSPWQKFLALVVVFTGLTLIVGAIRALMERS